jgi:hypothetical protein
VIPATGQNFLRKRVFWRAIVDHPCPNCRLSEAFDGLCNGLQRELVIDQPPAVTIEDHVFKVSVLVGDQLVPHCAGWPLGRFAEPSPNPVLDGLQSDWTREGVVRPLELTSETEHAISHAFARANGQARQLIPIGDHEHAARYLKPQCLSRKRTCELGGQNFFALDPFNA